MNVVKVLELRLHGKILRERMSNEIEKSMRLITGSSIALNHTIQLRSPKKILKNTFTYLHMYLF